MIIKKRIQKPREGKEQLAPQINVGEEKADGVEIAVVGRGSVIEKDEVVPAGANVEKEDK
jgi:hypothetical protein